MFVQLIVGLLVVHLLWGFFFLIGRLTLSSLPEPARTPPREELAVEVLIDIGVGAGLSILLLFVLGQLRLLTIPGIVVTALLLAASLIAIRIRQAKSLRAVTLDIGSPLRACLDWGLLVSYCAALPTVALPLLPPTLFDSTMYHFAHAIDWAHAGAITIDPFLRFPLFAYNYELIYSVFFTFHLDAYVQFATWITFASSIVATYALTRLVLSQNAISARWSTIGGLVASLSLAAYPTALYFADVGYIDIPAGFMFVAAIAASVLALIRPARFTAAIAICGGSFIGFKLPLFTYAPLFVFFVVLVSRSNFRRTLVNVLVFVIIAMPWYAYNFIIAGDPISPSLNLRVTGKDPFWTAGDYDPLVAAMHQGNALDALLHPITLITRGEALAFSVLLLYIPAIALGLSLFRRASMSTSIRFLNIASTYAVAMAILTSTMDGRYTLQFYAEYLAAITVALFQFATWMTSTSHPRVRNIALASATFLILVLALPSPKSAATFSQLTEQESEVGSAIAQPEQYLSANVTGYDAATDLANIELFSKSGGRVLATDFENTAYYFRRLDVISVGDWFGPGRYADLKRAVDAGTAADYLSRFHIDSAMFVNEGTTQVNDDIFTPQETQSFMAQLIAANFVDHTVAGSTVREFVRRDILAKAASSGYCSASIGAETDRCKS